MITVAASLAYIGAFHWVYNEYLSTTWEYYGFKNVLPSLLDLGLVTLIAALPSLWMPIHLERPSQAIYWALYVPVFIPSCLVPTYVGLQPAPDVLILTLLLILGFAIIGLGSRLKRVNFPKIRVSKTVFFATFWSVSILLTLWVIILFASSLRIASLDDVYTVRLPFIDISRGTGVTYAIMWLCGSIFPFMLAWGLWNKSLVWGAAAVTGQILMYGVGAFKSTIIFLAVVPALHFVSRNNGRGFGVKVALLSFILTAGLMSLHHVYDPSENDPVYYSSSIYFARVIGIPGLFTAQYHDFFSDHPLTYFSHINVIGAMFGYPYTVEIGYEIAGFYLKDPDVQANAHFWCSDGIASLGLIGIPVISVLVMLVLWVLDSLSRDMNPRFAILIVSYSMIALSNSSLFTTLLSGGLGISLLLMYLLPRGNNVPHENGSR